MSVACYVGLGANLDAPAARVERALEGLAALGPLRASSLYRTEPLGDPGQPWYVNAVAELYWGLTPEALLAELQELERRAGRQPGRARWAPRELDLDLLLCGSRVIAGPELQLPHPELQRRRFVLEPLAELAPGLVHPVLGRTIAELLAGLDDPLRVEKLPGQASAGPRASGPLTRPRRARRIPR